MLMKFYSFAQSVKQYYHAQSKVSRLPALVTIVDCTVSSFAFSMLSICDSARLEIAHRAAVMRERLRLRDGARFKVEFEGRNENAKTYAAVNTAR